MTKCYFQQTSTSSKFRWNSRFPVGRDTCSKPTIDKPTTPIVDFVEQLLPRVKCAADLKNVKNIQNLQTFGRWGIPPWFHARAFFLNLYACSILDYEHGGIKHALDMLMIKLCFVSWLMVQWKQFCCHKTNANQPCYWSTITWFAAKFNSVIKSSIQ